MSEPTPSRAALVVVAASAACFALGHVVAGTWTQGLVDVLASAGVELVITSPAQLRSPLLWTAAAIATSGVAGALSAGLAARVRRQPARLGPYLRAVAVMFLGANLGLGAKAVTLARIVVPEAVEKSAAGDALAIDLADLALWPWALAGVTCALIVHGAVVAVFAMLADEE